MPLFNYLGLHKGIYNFVILIHIMYNYLKLTFNTLALHKIYNCITPVFL